MGELNNPALIKAAKTVALSKATQKAKMAKSKANSIMQKPEAKKIAKGTGIALLAIAGAFISYKGYQIARRNQLLKKSYTDPEVKTAVDLWECVPEGFKNKWNLFTFLNPVKLIETGTEEIKTLWQRTNSQRVISIAERIHKNNLRIEKIAKYFKALYKLDLMELMNKVLTSEQVDMFYKQVVTGSSSTLPPAEKGHWAYATEDVFIREEPKIPAWYDSTNKWKLGKAGKIIGQVTGKEKAFNDNNKSVVFIEIIAFDSSLSTSKPTRILWVWKGALEIAPYKTLKEQGKINVQDMKQTLADKMNNFY